MACNVVGKDDLVEDMMADRMKVDIAVDNAVDNKVVVVHLVADETVQDSEIRSEWMVEEDDGNIVVVVLNWEEHDGRRSMVGCDNKDVM